MCTGLAAAVDTRTACWAAHRGMLSAQGRARMEVLFAVNGDFNRNQSRLRHCTTSYKRGAVQVCAQVSHLADLATQKCTKEAWAQHARASAFYMCSCEDTDTKAPIGRFHTNARARCQEAALAREGAPKVPQETDVVTLGYPTPVQVQGLQHVCLCCCCCRCIPAAG